MHDIIIQSDAQWKEVQELTRALRQPNLNRSLSVAINATARQVTTRATSTVAKEMGLKVGAVRGAIRVKKFSTPATLTAHVAGTGKPRKLIQWGGTQTPKGVMNKAWGQSKVYDGAFLATMKSGHYGIFARTRKNRGPRLFTGKPAPGYIKELWGPGIAPTMGERHVLAQLQGYGKDRLVANVLRQLQRYEFSQRRKAEQGG